MSTATTAVYLYIGLDAARHATARLCWPDLDNLNGFTGLVELCDDMAQALERWWEDKHPDPSSMPGVFDYEVTETMGSWLFHHINATPEEFGDELERFFTEWVG